MKKVFCVYIALFLLLSINVLAIGKIKSPEPNEIANASIEQEFTLRFAERIRWRFSGDEMNLKLKHLNTTHADFLIYSDARNLSERFEIIQYDKKSFDFDGDSLIDLSLILNNITIDFNKKRVGLTFTTEESGFKSRLEPYVPPQKTEEDDATQTSGESAEEGSGEEVEVITSPTQDAQDSEDEEDVQDTVASDLFLDETDQAFIDTIAETEEQTENATQQATLSGENFNQLMILGIAVLLFLMCIGIYFVLRNKD